MEDNTPESINDINTLNINEEYAKKFQHNKKRQLIEKQKAKGKLYINKDDDSEGSSYDSEEGVSEDSEGELDNEIVHQKFIDTLLRLKNDKETKNLLKKKEPIFNEEDFKQKRPKLHINEGDSKDKIAYSINDALINQKDDDINDINDIYSVHYKPKAKNENNEEKNAFINKAKEELNKDSDNNSNNSDFFDDGLLKKKNKKTKDTKEDNQSAKNENEDTKDNNKDPIEQIENMTLSEALKKAQIKPKNLNMKLLQDIWGDESKLSKDDKFLRNYILSEGWLEKDPQDQNKKFLLIDKIDEENDDKFDEFENKYNHRFEEGIGSNIITYQRNIDSYRHKDETRVEKRKEREKRKEEEKKKKTKEIQESKKLKGEELKSKLDKLEKIAGTEKIAELYKYFDNKENFDINEFDRKMNEVFNDEYYSKQLNEEEIKEFANQNEEEEEEKENDVNEEENEEEEDEEDEEPLWFYCDNCLTPLKPGKIKYECKTCDNFTLCKQCYKSKNHNHTMKKEKIPFNCIPPSNAEELIKSHLNEGILKCSRCSNEIISKYYFICNEDNCNQLKFCKECRGIGKSIHEHKLHKFFIEEKEEEEKKNPKEKLAEMIDNKTNAAIDDIIDKEIPSKFHYTKVAKDESDLTNEMLILLDDKVLNKYLPLKKIAAYSDYKLPEFKKKQMKKHLEKLLDKKKRQMYKEYEKKNAIERENEKFISKKRKDKQNKTKEGYINKSEFKKKKRLETYGINE